MDLMIEIERVALDWFRSAHLDIRDDGKLNKTAKTRKYTVFSRYNRSQLGYIRWHTPWRAYVFFPLNSIFDKDCMREVAQFLDDATRVHKERALPLALERKAATKEKKRRAKYLTKPKKIVTMDLRVEENGSCIPVER